MTQRTLNKQEKVFLFLYFLLTVGFYRSELLPVINLVYYLMLGVFTYSLFKSKLFLHSDYIKISTLFLIYAFTSIFWADSFDFAFSNYLELLKNIILSIVIISFCKNNNDTYFILKSLAFSGIIFCIISFSRFEDLTTAIIKGFRPYKEDELNLNLLGSIASISSIVFLFSTFVEKKKWYLVIFAISIILVFLTGSRKSIIAVFLGLLYFLFNAKINFKFYVLILVLMIGVLISIYTKEYSNAIMENLADLIGIISPNKVLGESDTIRLGMLESALNHFLTSPLIGNGYFSFPILYAKETGQQTYAHNNYLEILSDIGIIGFVLFYMYFFLMIHRAKRSISMGKQTLINALLIMTLFNQLAIVILGDRFSWILLSIIFAGTKFSNFKINENKFLNEQH